MGWRLQRRSTSPPPTEIYESTTESTARQNGVPTINDTTCRLFFFCEQQACEKLRKRKNEKRAVRFLIKFYESSTESTDAQRMPWTIERGPTCTDTPSVLVSYGLLYKCGKLIQKTDLTLASIDESTERDRIPPQYELPAVIVSEVHDLRSLHDKLRCKFER